MTNNPTTRTAINSITITENRGRRRPCGLLATVSVLTFTALLTACGSDGSASETSSVTGPNVATVTSAPPTIPSTSAAPAEPFHSDLYGYVISSTDWSGLSASTAWDGTGSPGSGDPTVDMLHASDTQQAYAFAGPTTATLGEFVAASRASNAAARGCPEIPSKTEPISVSGEPGILDEVVCGVFAISATVIHTGRAYVFFTYDQPGKEDEMRVWFGALLDTVAFDS
jgi:hypothetical protein